MNILESYIKYNNKIIILITGIDTDVINKIGDILAKDLNIDIIKCNEIFNNNYLVDLNNIDEKLLKDKLKDKKNYIITNFSNILSDNTFNFYINIKFDNKKYIEKNIENSKNIYFKYKKNLEEFKPNKFIRFENITDTTNNIWDYLMTSIKINLDKFHNNNNNNNNNNYNNNNYNNNNYNNYNNKDSSENYNKELYKESSSENIEGNKELYKSNKKEYKKKKIFRTPSKEKLEFKTLSDIYKKNSKKENEWDKDNIYVDIDKHRNMMLKTKRYNKDIMYDYDEDLYKEMEDSSYSPETKPFFYSTKNYFSNMVGGGGKKKIIYGLRYLFS